jgi:hypothetical protein
MKEAEMANCIIKDTNNSSYNMPKGSIQEKYPKRTYVNDIARRDNIASIDKESNADTNLVNRRGK